MTLLPNIVFYIYNGLMKTIWAKISENLKMTLESGVFKVWVAPLQAHDVNGELRITAPNAFMAAYVERHLLGNIRGAASKALGIAESEVLITVGTRQEAEERAPSDGASVIRRVLPKLQATLPLTQIPVETITSQWRYSFEDFVTGPSNSLAFAAARDISLSGEIQTLFVNASPGLGKTHLAQAAGAALATAGEGKKVAYLTAEDFASRFVQAMKCHELETLKQNLCCLDMLLLEDVHFLQRKKAMQEMMLAIIKNIEAKRGRIIFTSSFAPRELQDMDPQLLSHFCSGILALMGKPDEKMRREILERKAKTYQVYLPENVCSILANRLTGDIRQLESCLKSMCFKAKLLKCGLTPELALEAARQYSSCQNHLDMNEIIRLVCESYGIEENQLKSKSRRKECVQGRNTIFYLARKHTDLSLTDIGSTFNRRHTTVLRNITAVERELARQSIVGRQIARTVDLIERQACL